MAAKYFRTRVAARAWPTQQSIISGRGNALCRCRCERVTNPPAKFSPKSSGGVWSLAMQQVRGALIPIREHVFRPFLSLPPSFFFPQSWPGPTDRLVERLRRDTPTCAPAHLTLNFGVIAVNGSYGSGAPWKRDSQPPSPSLVLRPTGLMLHVRELSHWVSVVMTLVRGPLNGRSDRLIRA